VDSQHIFHHLNENLPLDEIHGYGVAEWVEKDKPNRVFLCKLAGGELAIWGVGTGPEDCRGVIWSSDSDHIKAAVGAAHIDTFQYKVEVGTVYYVERGKLSIDSSRKLEINRDTSRDWRSGFDYSGFRA
jgi:hypothetical protein